MASAALGTQHYGSFYLRMGAVGNYLNQHFKVEFFFQ